LFISEEPPHGATVLVFRRAGVGEPEFLVLHRADARDLADWAWGPPASTRLPGEDVIACARRELEAATGLRLALHRVDAAGDWAEYWAEAPVGAEIALSSEHDRFDWVPIDEARRRCQPAIVAEQFDALAAGAAA
jgi:8-oxo-dGTP pyrophosphatase MutT (NUDIX family)